MQLENVVVNVLEVSWKWCWVHGASVWWWVCLSRWMICNSPLLTTVFESRYVQQSNGRFLSVSSLIQNSLSIECFSNQLCKIMFHLNLTLLYQHYCMYCKIYWKLVCYTKSFVAWSKSIEVSENISYYLTAI